MQRLCDKERKHTQQEKEDDVVGDGEYLAKWGCGGCHGALWV